MRFAIALLALLTAAVPAAAQQVPNMNADMSVVEPAYPAERGPRVLIDQGHDNFHAIGGRYAPFARLLANDGYRVAPHPGRISALSLASADILVIANAGPADGPDAPSAFTAEEIAALKAWVEGGGALLLVADHRPFAGAAASLGAAFGIRFHDAYAIDQANGEMDMFRIGAGLAEHPITAGAEGDPAVTQVRSFTGSAFEAPGASPLLTLGEGFVLLGGVEAAGSAAGMLQGATLQVGRGRVVVMGEAAMFTSQLAGAQRRIMGIGAPGTEQNKQFALNLMHWLSRRRGY